MKEEITFSRNILSNDFLKKLFTKYDFILYLVLFCFSFLNQYTLLIFLCSLFFLLLTQNTLGAIKSLILITLRGLINTGIAVSFTGYLSLIKWALLFGNSAYILFCSNMKVFKDKKIVKLFSLFLIITTYIIIQSMFCSTYPIVSIAKYISYSFVFFSLIIGCYDGNAQNVFSYLEKCMVAILIISIPLLFSSLGYFVNGRSFQGILNQPNMLGIFCALTLAVVYADNKNIVYKLFMLFLILFEIIKTQSRTSLFSAIVIIIMFFFTSNKILAKYKVYFPIFALTLSIGIIIVYPSIYNKIYDYVFKGYEGNLFFSRRAQIELFLNRMNYNMWFGTGFSTPFIADKQYFTFSFNYIVEDGNLILATLGYVGIIGFILFFALYFYIFKSNRRRNNNTLLFFAPMLISLGEMTFFSTNNLGVILYIFYAVYFSQSLIEEKEETNQ